ncbi:hypothetical protein Tco_0152942 [Tanacetum coccineum]
MQCWQKHNICMLAKAQASEASSKAKVEACGRWATKKASAPVFYGPSTQGLLDAYGYNTIEEYLSWNYFPSTDNESTDMETTDKRNTDKDCIVDSNSAMSKGICQAVLNLFLYDADTLLHPNHHPVSIWDSEELNALMFVPQKELSGDQAYWLSANEIASQALNYKQCIVTSMPPMQIWKLTSKDNSFKGKSNDTNPGLLDAQINIMKVLKLGTTEGEYSLSRTAYTERGLVAFTAEKYQS